MRALVQPRRLIPWVSLLLVSAPVLAGPVLHERFSPNPAEDLRFGATTPSGKMPATIETRSGLVSAPEEGGTRPNDATAYGGAHTPTSADASYHIDRLTTRPDRVKYDEPFRPSILPFKRLYAFDWLKKDLSFGVLKNDLTVVTVGGVLQQTEDAFFGDFEVDLVRNVPVRIPSVGPGAKIRALHLDPPQEVEILKDSAENWFVRAKHGGRARMVLQLSILRETFGSQFLPVTWEALAPYVVGVPEAVRGEARDVAQRIGVSEQDAPARALMSLVDYFRRFEASPELPQSTDAAALYRELSFEQKGVCRHRAYAFAITALSLGLPTRVVHNEAHAWVEVFDTEIWHRIDLGGAAADMEQSRPDPNSLSHRPPGDPYSWPSGSHSGASVARQVRQALAEGAASSTSSEGAETDPNTTEEETQKGGWPSASTSTNPDPSDPFGFLSSGKRVLELTFGVQEKQLLRGRPLSVSGTAQRDGIPCSLSRVDIFVHSTEGPISIGSVATNRDGDFRGHVTLPPTTPVGPLELFAQIGAGCE